MKRFKVRYGWGQEQWLRETILCVLQSDPLYLQLHSLRSSKGMSSMCKKEKINPLSQMI